VLKMGQFHNIIFISNSLKVILVHLVISVKKQRYALILPEAFRAVLDSLKDISCILDDNGVGNENKEGSSYNRVGGRSKFRGTPLRLKGHKEAPV
jgi:hypothetical protein